MRVVHPEGPHALVDPEAHDAQQRVPERLPGRGREVDRVDVLVLLGRVLRVLDGAVGPLVEPLRVLAHPRVIRRALDREVERDLDPQALRGLHEAAEVLERAELRVHRGVAALGRRRWPTGCPDRRGPRPARCPGPCARCGRWDGSAAGRRRRSPCAGSRAAGRRSRRRCRGGRATRPCERGNSSYHAAKAAAGRSTTTSSSRSWRVRSGRGWTRAITWRRSGSSSTSRRRSREDAASSRSSARASAAASAPRAASRARRSIAPPSSSSLVRSAWPPARRRRISSTQEPKASVQASTV